MTFSPFSQDFSRLHSNISNAIHPINSLSLSETFLTPSLKCFDCNPPRLRLSLSQNFLPLHANIPSTSYPVYFLLSFWKFLSPTHKYFTATHADYVSFSPYFPRLHVNISNATHPDYLFCVCLKISHASHKYLYCYLPRLILSLFLKMSHAYP